jgi:DNA-binding NtrC family response regulator
MSEVTRHILLVEDQDALRAPIAAFFRDRGYHVHEAATFRAAEAAFRATRPDAAVIDYGLPDRDGIELIRALHALDATVPLVLLTGFGTIDLAVKAIKEGAEQFLTKPTDLPTLAAVVERAVTNQRNRQIMLADQTRAARLAIDPFQGPSPAIRRLKQQAERLVGLSRPVLILGPTGSGKGVLASWLHRAGPRAQESFVDLNCAALSRELLESELFGHERGAFTGAVQTKPGLLEIAHRGTLFLDEIGDMDASVQARMLKVVEDQRFRRLGDVRDRQVDVRLVAATHHDLRQRVQQGLFREDLWYRINSLTLVVPPLADRPEDLLDLARTIVEQVAAEMKRSGVRLSPAAEKAIVAYPWPGNLRELRNALERAVILGGRETLGADDLGEAVVGWSAAAPAPVSGTLKDAERRHIEDTLREEQWDVRRTAARLGVSRSALYARLQKHGIAVPRNDSPA